MVVMSVKSLVQSEYPRVFFTNKVGSIHSTSVNPATIGQSRDLAQAVFYNATDEFNYNTFHLSYFLVSSFP